MLTFVLVMKYGGGTALIFLCLLLPGLVNLLVVIGLLSREAWAYRAGVFIFLFTAIPGILFQTVFLCILLADCSGFYLDDRTGPPPLWLGILEQGTLLGPLIIYTACLIFLFFLLRHDDVQSFYKSG